MAIIPWVSRAWRRIETRAALERARGPAPPPLLVHFHIFKNAGSSLDQLLAESFGPAFAAYESQLPFQQVNHDGLRPFLAAHPGIRAVSSHLPRRFLLGPDCLPLMLLRHPVDRARSVYQFIRRDATATDNPIAQLGFASYVAWALDTPGQGISIRNYQVFHLSGTKLTADNPGLVSTRDDLRQVVELLRLWPCFGLVRQFAASCQLFQKCYEPAYPALRLRERRENVSPDAAGSQEAAIDAARAELGPALYARLCAANELDFELYMAAEKLFHARVRGEG